MMNTLFAVPVLIFNLILLGVAIYCMVLFIKLSHRGIRALDLYIDKEESKKTEINRYVIKDEGSIE